MTKEEVIHKKKVNMVLITILINIDFIYSRLSENLFRANVLFPVTFALVTFICFLVFRNSIKKLDELLEDGADELKLIEGYNDYSQWIIFFVIFAFLGPVAPSNLGEIYGKVGLVGTLFFSISGLGFYGVTVYLIVKTYVWHMVFDGSRIYHSKFYIEIKDLKKYQTLKMKDGCYSFVFNEGKQLFRLKLDEDELKVIEKLMME